MLDIGFDIYPLDQVSYCVVLLRYSVSLIMSYLLNLSIIERYLKSSNMKMDLQWLPLSLYVLRLFY